MATKKAVKVEKKEPKIEVEPKVVEAVKVEALPMTEKQELEVVYQFMKDRGINSISDIENKIARL